MHSPSNDSSSRVFHLEGLRGGIEESLSKAREFQVVRFFAIVFVTLFSTLSLTDGSDMNSQPEGQWLKLKVTAYEPSERSCGIWADGITSTGKPARMGTIAVDPRLIPLGTRLFVPQYGWGVAEDIGGAIKGQRIDVFFWTVDEALEWGIKELDVFVAANKELLNTKKESPITIKAREV